MFLAPAFENSNTDFNVIRVSKALEINIYLEGSVGNSFLSPLWEGGEEREG